MVQGFFNRLIIWIILPVIIFSLYYSWRRPHQTISLIPYAADTANFLIYSYSDSLKSPEKASTVYNIKVNDTLITFSYKLGEGYQFPYAGVTLFAKDNSFFDLTSYDYLEMDIQATTGKRPQVILGLHATGFTNPEKTLTYRYLVKDVDLKKDQSKFIIPLDKFITPTWWYAENNVSEKDFKSLEFDKTKIINIQNCQLLGKNVPDSISIRELKFTKNVGFFYQTAGVVLICYFLIIGIISFTRKKPKEQVQKIEIQYTPVQITSQSDQDLQKVINFISTNYQDPELSLKKIQLATGLSENKISSLIKDSFSLSFKQYLNNLRLTEAKRLLMDLTLPVSDIAYKVGYGNISHFNRVFKESLGISPNDYRKKNKAQI
ncbi:helix-turn-helix domain-containing protein [Sporocytophaga myxococcoides]|uniref:helix-turn-helix domain-containing protein n=1 Tax=Sporocytophaga myxococcoides TaxID=153721 RepID=UPI000415540F|nr:AraC family transcriptional regulator [Sporocytophaga myxococcoides]